jgi:DNA repair and recombination protein RAD52
MTFTDVQNKALAAPLDPKHIKPPPKGKFGSYVDGFHIVTEANRIFGHDGWSYFITKLELCSRVETTDSRNEPQIRVGYFCTVRAEAGGASREGAAVGSGMAKPQNEADAHESAVKEAETDALKRALRSFGHTFGLALYDKSDTNENIATPPAEMPDAEWAKLVQLCEAAKADTTAMLRHYGVESLRHLNQDQYGHALAALNTKLAKMAKDETDAKAKEAA